MWMLSTWSAWVIGLSTDTVSGTLLPVSTIEGNSSLTLPGATGASPIKSRIASAIAASVAPAEGASEASPAPAAANRIRRRVCRTAPTEEPPPQPSPARGGGRDPRSGRVGAFGAADPHRSFGAISLVPQGHQERYHILDLLGGEDRLAAPGLTDAGQPFHPVVCRHDRGGVEARWVDEAQSQFALRPTRTGPRQIRREGRLEC